MGAEMVDPRRFSGSHHYIPNRPRAEPKTGDCAASAHTAPNRARSDPRSTGPLVQSIFRRRGYRHGTNPPAFSDEVCDDPPALALLNSTRLELRVFLTAQSA